MKRSLSKLIAGLALAVIASTSLTTVKGADSIALTMESLNSVIYIDGIAASGGVPSGLSALENLADAYENFAIKGSITAVFDDDATPIVLRDPSYENQSGTDKGNPYAKTIAALQEKGVVIVVCGNDLSLKALSQKDLIEGVKTTPRGILLVAQLAQSGAFCLPTPLPGTQQKD